jgi:undecaprenyl-diphosphatase
MKKYFVILFIFAIAHNVCAESAYTLNLTKDLIIGSAVTGLTITSLFINHSAENASKDDIPQKDSVNSFDRGLMYEYDKPLDIVSDIAMYGLLVTPVLSLVGNIKDGNAWLTYGVMYAESILLVYGTAELIKNSFVRYRPYGYFGDIPPGKENEYYKSFPSRHTAFAFMSAGFLTSTFFTEYPQSSWKVPVCAVSYTLAAGMGASRIFTGNHFISDVLAGAVIGSVSGYLIPWLHLRKKNDTVSFIPLPNGFMTALKF